MTPSGPTVSSASAMISPISGSLLAAIVATWASSCLPWTSRAARHSSSHTRAAACSIPRRSSMGLAPLMIWRIPSRIIAWARTVAVVVPSPTASDVWLATSRTRCAPMFSNGSGRWISLATLTPSWVIIGAPAIFSSTTLRPLGPSVTLTASASLLTPVSRYRRASSL